MQRKSGRPLGTDGSDFSYRMVVDSRYTKVAKGKSRLATLFTSQAVLEFLALAYYAVLLMKDENFNILAISCATGLLSLLIGEFGRRRSRVGFLKLYMATSLAAMLLSVFGAVMSKVLTNPIDWETKKFELIEIGLLLLTLLLQIFTISSVASLISNMSPPKKTS